MDTDVPFIGNTPHKILSAGSFDLCKAVTAIICYLFHWKRSQDAERECWLLHPKSQEGSYFGHTPALSVVIFDLFFFFTFANCFEEKVYCNCLVLQRLSQRLWLLRTWRYPEQSHCLDHRWTEAPHCPVQHDRTCFSFKWRDLERYWPTLLHSTEEEVLTAAAHKHHFLSGDLSWAGECQRSCTTGNLSRRRKAWSEESE